MHSSLVTGNVDERRTKEEVEATEKTNPPRKWACLKCIPHSSLEMQPQAMESIAFL